MGHYIKKIIREDEELMPAVFSLAGNPNFAQFVSLTDNDGQSGRVRMKIKVLRTDVQPEQTQFEIKDSLTGTERLFGGTTNHKEVSNSVFFLADDVSVIAENIRACLMKDSFFRSNFEIVVSPVYQYGMVKSGDTIDIVSKGVGAQYCFTFEAKNSAVDVFLSTEGDPSVSQNNDSVIGSADSCEIELDVYNDTGLFPGQTNDLSLGTYVTTLTKSYFGKPLWFDLNAIAGDQKSYSSSFLHTDGWCNAGTVSDYRFVAKRYDGLNREVFYLSDVCYAINGYDRVLAKNDMSAYVYNVCVKNIVEPLTKQSEQTHIKGQKQFFNFLLSKTPWNANGKIGIMYRVYSQSENHIADVIMNEFETDRLNIVNTLQLDIDEVVQNYSNAGLVKVYLVHDGQVVSKPLAFRLLPSCLYEVNDFAFLNSLGGWSSFNFGGMRQTEFKAGKETIFKTRTPQYDSSADIESVIRKDVDEQFVVETIPIDASTADWLKEISASVAVYELSSKRYVVVDELSVKHNSRDDLFTLQMKYHYSDSYNGYNS